MDRVNYREYVPLERLDARGISKPYAEFKILTMGITCDLGVKIRHDLVFKHFEFSRGGLIFLESANQVRKLADFYHPKVFKRVQDIRAPNVKSIKKKTRKSDNNSFNNQVALFLEYGADKITHVKIFKNSALQLCGIHDIEHFNQCMTYIVDMLSKRKIEMSVYKRLEDSVLGCNVEQCFEEGKCAIINDLPYTIDCLAPGHFHVHSGYAKDDEYFVRKVDDVYTVAHHLPPFFEGPLTYGNFQINLVTATIRLNFTLNNERLFQLIHKHRKDLHTEYDSTRNKSFRITKSIPAETRHQKRDLLFFIFDNGKIIFTGATTSSEIQTGFNFITELLRGFRPQIFKPNIHTLYSSFLTMKGLPQPVIRQRGSRTNPAVPAVQETSLQADKPGQSVHSDVQCPETAVALE